MRLAMIALVVAAFCAHGLVHLFARDLLWGITEKRSRARGVALERTEKWDRVRKTRGISSLVLAGVVIAWEIYKYG
jgi:hypothetical protein